MNKAVTQKDLFENWKKELGENKARLLLCNYPIKTVLAMNEEEAEGELEAIGFYE